MEIANNLKTNVFSYLERLRDSGVINMMGASSYIEEEFELDNKTSKHLLISWIKTFKHE